MITPITGTDQAKTSIDAIKRDTRRLFEQTMGHEEQQEIANALQRHARNVEHYIEYLEAAVRALQG